jgi:hypothetical protein
MNASEFGHYVKALGFRVFLAKESWRGGYGFITDADGTRVLSFSFTDGSSLSGNYGPPSRESGTGWRMDETPYDLKSADDVKRALYAEAPEWTGRRGRGWKHYTTLAEHLGMYGSSSGYTEI